MWDMVKSLRAKEEIPYYHMPDLTLKILRDQTYVVEKWIHFLGCKGVTEEQIRQTGPTIHRHLFKCPKVMAARIDSEDKLLIHTFLSRPIISAYCYLSLPLLGHPTTPLLAPRHYMGLDSWKKRKSDNIRGAEELGYRSETKDWIMKKLQEGYCDTHNKDDNAEHCQGTGFDCRWTRYEMHFICIEDITMRPNHGPKAGDTGIVLLDYSSSLQDPCAVMVSYNNKSLSGTQKVNVTSIRVKAVKPVVDTTHWITAIAARGVNDLFGSFYANGDGMNDLFGYDRRRLARNSRVLAALATEIQEAERK